MQDVAVPTPRLLLVLVMAVTRTMKVAASGIEGKEVTVMFQMLTDMETHEASKTVVKDIITATGTVEVVTMGPIDITMVATNTVAATTTTEVATTAEIVTILARTAMVVAITARTAIVIVTTAKITVTDKETETVAETDRTARVTALKIAMEMDVEIGMAMAIVAETEETTDKTMLADATGADIKDKPMPEPPHSTIA
jgi:hypothetical protein